MLYVLYRPQKCKANAPLMFVKVTGVGYSAVATENVPRSLQRLFGIHIFIGFYGTACSSLSSYILSMISLLFFPRKFSK